MAWQKPQMKKRDATIRKANKRSFFVLVVVLIRDTSVVV
jgi:hypothetical protein